MRMTLPHQNTPFSEEEARSKLAQMDQSHLFEGWELLSPAEKALFLLQVQKLDPSFFLREQKCALEWKIGPLEPFSDYFLKGSSEDEKNGRTLISQGACMALTVAGGQGSRLRLNGPKGCYPISLVKKKSLFQLLAEKIKAAGKQAGRPLEWVVTTSPLNHEETLLFFKEHHFFGLIASQVHFFCQEMWPLLDREGNLFLEAPGLLAQGPNGNGGALRQLATSSFFQTWKEQGITSVSFTLIDNLLADPFDQELLGFHNRLGNEITLKAIFRQNAEEKVGIVVLKEGKPAVVEYSECPEEVKRASTPEGFAFPLANTSLFCFSLSFIEKTAGFTLPLHAAKKAVKRWTAATGTVFPEEPNAWKFEEFIFDLLPFGKKVSALVYPREECFAPLKNSESVAAVQRSLQARDAQIFSQITGVQPPTNHPFELAQEFYYPTEELIDKWRGRKLPSSSYITAKDE